MSGNPPNAALLVTAIDGEDENALLGELVGNQEAL